MMDWIQMGSLIALTLLSAVLMRFHVGRRKMIRKLETANEALSASNQQLMASEQQLKAANQQLAASEQQLKAAFQQLATGEDILRQNEEKYRMIMGHMPSCAAVYEAIDGGDDFILRDLNRAAERTERIMKESVLGRRVTEVFPGIREMGLLNVLREVYRTGQQRHHPLAVYKDANLIGWRDNYVYKLPSGEVVAVYSDETERVVAQKRLQESEESFRTLYASLNEGMVIHEVLRDSEGRITDYRILSVNPSFEKITGILARNAEGRLATELYGTKEPPYLKEYGEVVDTRRPYVFETYFSPMKKHFLISVVSPGKDKFATLFFDVTELRKLRDERSRLFDLSLDMISIAGSDGYYKQLNPAWSKVTGWPIQTLLSKPWIEFVHPADRQATIDAKVVLDAGKELAAFENRFQCADGTFKTLSWSACPVPEDGLYYSLARDITEYKRNQEELAKGQRLESLGILAAGIAHDFNNLLVGLFGYIDVAMDEAPEGSGIKRKLFKAMTAFERAKALTQQLLTFSKGGAPIKTVVTLPSIVQSAARLAVSGSSVTFHLDGDPELHLCEADEGQIGQVISNIVINARQAMPSGGLIKIRLGNKVVRANEISALVAGDYVVVAVSDTGIGIPPENLDKIFDPFFTTKQDGSGLGLATSYSIVQKHGGTIIAESKLGEGTVISVFLPAAPGARRSAESKSQQKRPERGHGRILVMDDEAIVRDMSKDMLEELGYSVETVANGAIAIERYVKTLGKSDQFDLVILDLTVPGGIGGVATLAELKKIDAGVQAIVSSGYSDSPILANPGAHGFSGVATKPYRISELSAVIQTILAKHGKA
jgi:PAS domain S-box-containing protein